ncbi:hypothetical protein HC031_13060 [Planosporangium thailandense]|uniref:Uncharacterized protein n=1 Tax=Planosporangium thailandense TaxID=765197 RepID=A0ABX0XX77_9ACTN|nr:hypothetical protein [Planosporangium thailandense]NJC70635.1 hypothetical protein [Planosporangium thailandense]
MTSMKACHYAPLAALETEPVGAYTDPGLREEALRDALRGIDLGTYDERMIDWTVRQFDNSALRVLVSWIERARRAATGDGLEVDRVRRNRGRNWSY